MIKLKTKDKNIELQEFDNSIQAPIDREEELARITFKTQKTKQYSFVGEYGEKYKDNRTGVSINANNKKYHILQSIPKKQEKATYLTFSSETPLSITSGTLTKGNPPGEQTWYGTLEYSTDLITWNTFSGGTIKSDTGTIYMRGVGNKTITTVPEIGRWTFSTSSQLKVFGNIENLLDYKIVKEGGHPTVGNYCFTHMFSGCYRLSYFESIDTIGVSSMCYYRMFSGCSNLLEIPKFTYESIDGCNEMFYSCTSLKNATLPMTNLLRNGCYSDIFAYCNNLTEIHVPKNIMGHYYIHNNFPGKNCPATVYYDL